MVGPEPAWWGQKWASPGREGLQRVRRGTVFLGKSPIKQFRSWNEAVFLQPVALGNNKSSSPGTSELPHCSCSFLRGRHLSFLPAPRHPFAPGNYTPFSKGGTTLPCSLWPLRAEGDKWDGSPATPMVQPPHPRFWLRRYRSACGLSREMKGPNDCDINLVVLLHTVLFLCAQLVPRHSYIYLVFAIFRKARRSRRGLKASCLIFSWMVYLQSCIHLRPINLCSVFMNRYYTSNTF